jgi:hypothetical protein
MGGGACRCVEAVWNGRGVTPPTFYKISKTCHFDEEQPVPNLFREGENLYDTQSGLCTTSDSAEVFSLWSKL